VRSFLALQRCFRLADRAGRDPRAPPGRVLGRPVGDVEVERADGEQVVQGVDPRRGGLADPPVTVGGPGDLGGDALLSLIHISEPTRRTPISYAVFCLK